MWGGDTKESHNIVLKEDNSFQKQIDLNYDNKNTISKLHIRLMRRDVRWMYRGGLDGSITEEDWVGESPTSCCTFFFRRDPAFLHHLGASV